jgi:hypothetical protein
MVRVNLNVPYEEKDLAKAEGAKWDKEERVWYVDSVFPWRSCQKYLTTTAYPFENVRDWQDYSYDQRAEARDAGCLWDPNAKCWYKPE